MDEAPRQYPTLSAAAVGGWLCGARTLYTSEVPLADQAPSPRSLL